MLVGQVEDGIIGGQVRFSCCLLLLGGITELVEPDYQALILDDVIIPRSNLRKIRILQPPAVWLLNHNS